MTESFQPALFVEDIHTAFSDVVRALGGFKRVGSDLRPDKPADEAGRWLADCLNKDRRERLEYEQVLWLLKEARKVGCHTAMHFISEQSGYAAPVPVEPDDEVAELQRQFMASVQAQARIVERLERLQPSLKRAA
jgi:hypothetical protein